MAFNRQLFLRRSHAIEEKQHGLVRAADVERRFGKLSIHRIEVVSAVVLPHPIRRVESDLQQCPVAGASDEFDMHERRHVLRFAL